MTTATATKKTDAPKKTKREEKGQQPERMNQADRDKHMTARSLAAPVIEVKSGSTQVMMPRLQACILAILQKKNEGMSKVDIRVHLGKRFGIYSESNVGGSCARLTEQGFTTRVKEGLSYITTVTAAGKKIDTSAAK